MTSSLANTSAAERAPSRQPRLNPVQQRILAAVIEAAQRKPGGHVCTDRNRLSYWASHWRGRTKWSVIDAFGFLIASGEAS